MKRVMVSLSGGLDSCVTLGYVRQQLKLLASMYEANRPTKMMAVGFTYGSKHNEYENEAAKNIAQHYDIEFRLIDLTAVMQSFRSNLLKSGGAIPEGHYEAPSMTQTVVPGRNMIFVSILAGLAESLEFDTIALGIHSGDHHIYPDCRPDFFVAVSQAVRESTEGRVGLYAPFINDPKQTLVKRGHELGVPFHLTRTCYKDQPVACGKCGACQERKEAFALNGLVDPLRYEE